MTRSALLIAVSFPLIAGCGTFADALAGPADDHLYYRGVRMDVASIKKGVPIMVLDLPLSACADTILVPSIAIGQLNDPPGTKHKSVVEAVGEGLTKAVATDVIIPVTLEVMKTVDNDSRTQQPPSAIANVQNRGQPILSTDSPK
jgi:uncharacterized protein YceK